MHDLESYPGGHHVVQGLENLATATNIKSLSESAALLLLARPKLMQLGFSIPPKPQWAHQDAIDLLFDKVEGRLKKGQVAHSAVNALRREIMSFASVFGNLSRSDPGRRPADT